jgi:HD-GYP hydrolase domain containing protein
MEEKLFVRRDDIQIGMQLGEQVKDIRGRAMIENGVYLDAYQVRYIKEKKLPGIYIYRVRDDKDIKIPEKTKQIIRQHRKPDRAKIQLSVEMKKQLEERMNHIFDHTEDKDFATNSLDIFGELESAIFKNDAVAIDVNLIKISDEYTFKHSVDVAAISMMIGREYGLPKEELHQLGIAGLLHDVGKARIPNEILNKPGKLTDDEFRVIQNHSLFGYEILKEKNSFSPIILDGVLHHHEKMNGMGYPDNLGSSQISLFSRIISVADVFDALVTKRPYKGPITGREAMEMVLAMGSELDNAIIQSFIESVILYPVDTIVELSTGQMAKVVENNKRYPTRPKVVELQTGMVYDLCHDMECNKIIVL